MHGKNRDTDVENGLIDTAEEKERVGQIERVSMPHRHHHV